MLNREDDYIPTAGKVYFHSTKTSNIPSILECGGLELSKSSEGCIYLAEDSYTAACFQLIHGVKDFSVIGIKICDDDISVEPSYDHNEEYFKKIYPQFKKCYYTENNIYVDYFTGIWDFINGEFVEREDWFGM